MQPETIVFLYLGLISLITVAVTVLDKIEAKEKGSRVPEKLLLWLAVFGGSVAEYLTMKLIRHKTKKSKFMVGLPLILMSQVTLAYLIWRFLL